MSAERQITILQEILRKTLHVGVLILPFWAYTDSSSNPLIVIGSVAVMGMCIDVFRARIPSIEKAVQGIFGKLMRPEEQSVDSKIRFNGATVILVSFSLLILLFPRAVAVAAFGIFVVGDAFAALIGRAFGQTRWFRSSKTLEGSIAFILAGLPAFILFPELHPMQLVVGILMGAFTEATASNNWDNLLVPLVVATSMLLVQLFV